MKLQILLVPALLLVLAKDSALNLNNFFNPKIQNKKLDTTVLKVSKFENANNDNSIYSNLNNINFDVPISFKGEIFSVPAQFYSSEFNYDVNFSDCEFKEFADFSGVNFKRDAVFKNSKFNDFLFLSGISLSQDTRFNFYNAVLPPLIDFSHISVIQNTIDFTNADFERQGSHIDTIHQNKYYINLYNTNIGKVKLNYDNFRLCFYDRKKDDPIIRDILNRFKYKFNFQNKSELMRAVYSLTRLDEYKKYIREVFPNSKISDSLLIKNYTTFYINLPIFPSRLHADQIEAVFARLLKNFEENGQLDSHKNLDIEYQDYLWSNKNIFTRWLSIFPKYWNCYGNEKDNILIWTVLMLSLFTAITFIFYGTIFKADSENKVVYHLINIPELKEKPKNTELIKLKNAFVFTSIVFFSFSLKTEKIDFKNPVFIYVFVINILGLLCLAYLANFILQK